MNWNVDFAEAQKWNIRKTLVWVALVTILGVMAGCEGGISNGNASTSTKPSAENFGGIAGAASPVGATSGRTLSPRQICQGSLKSSVLLEWAPATLAAFRKYQYGGPKATVPLAHVVASLPGSSRGAWCGTKAGLEATHWWAVIVGQKPASLMIMTGGVEGVKHGLVLGPPQVP